MFEKIDFMIWESKAEELRNVLFGCSRVNKNGVAIQFHPKKEVGVELGLSYPVPGFRGGLSYFIWYERMEDFAMDHAIFEEEDLDRIVPADLVKKFEAGQGRIYCEVGNDRYLIFGKEDVFVYAEDYDSGIHLVCVPLIGVEDYLDYTRSYYEH